VAAALVVLAAAGGCDSFRLGAEDEQVPRFPDGIRVAVAPALNFSGSSDFDPMRVADLMASELGGFPGVAVIGVNRVTAILAEQGLDGVQSPEHALELCDRLGADAIVVFAITEYDAYTPCVGMAAQLYGESPSGPVLDPVAISRMARPFPVIAHGDARRPIGQVQRVFNAAHESVQDDVRAYARTREAYESPHGWRKYLASQEWYLRYCCYSVGRDLMAQQIHEPAATHLAAAEESTR
jgi:hypothetical protein